MNRLPVCQTGEVGFCHTAPVPPDPVHRDDMIVVPSIGEHVDDERRVSDKPECGRGEKSSVKAMCNPVVEDGSWRPVPLFRAVGEREKELLNLERGGELFQQGNVFSGECSGKKRVRCHTFLRCQRGE